MLTHTHLTVQVPASAPRGAFRPSPTGCSGKKQARIHAERMGHEDPSEERKGDSPREMDPLNKWGGGGC